MKDTLIKYVEVTIPQHADLMLPIGDNDRVQVLDVRPIAGDLRYQLVVIRDA